MEELTLDRLQVLARHQPGPCLTLYMPTHRAGPATQQDPIRFKNLLRRGARDLAARGLSPRDVDTLLAPAQALLADTGFWQHQREGLAVFLASGEFHPFRLPFTVDERLVVAPAYVVSPVLPLFTANGHYYVLALSQNDVRLFEATRYSIGQLDLPPDLPTSLEETLRFDDPEKQLQFHTGTPQGGVRAGMFHGHGLGDERQRAQIEQYLKRLDAGLMEILRDQQTPLVLAGVEYLLPIYRRVSNYASIMPEGLEGNPEQWRPEELHARAAPILEPVFRQAVEQALAQYQQVTGTALATDQLAQVVPAAVYGRIAQLIMAAEAPQWGRFDWGTGQVVHTGGAPAHPDDIPLTDVAAVQTLQNGGSVFAVAAEELPGASTCLAVLRY